MKRKNRKKFAYLFFRNLVSRKLIYKKKSIGSQAAKALESIMNEINYNELFE